MALRNLFKHTIDWERPYITTDDSRGSTRSFQKQETGMHCLVQPMSGKDRLLYAQRQVMVTHNVYFDRILDLRPGDRFYHLPHAGLPGRYYVVQSWFDQGGQLGRCFCVQVTEQK